MPESFPEQVNRLAAMMHDDGQTWDLTQNDQAAIRAVLAELNRLEAALQQAREALANACDDLEREGCGTHLLYRAALKGAVR